MPAQDVPEVLTRQIAVLLQVALAQAQAMGERALADLGVTGREYGLLAVLEHPSPDAAQHRLGAALGIDRTTTMSLLAGLERRGLVRRERRPGDRRAYAVSLTDDGEALRRRAAAVLQVCEERFLEPLPPPLRAGLRDALLVLARQGPASSA